MANVIDKVAGLVVGPQGPQGPQGPKGDTGQTGPQGATGATGATPNLTMGTVTTLEPDSPATATITGTAENPVLNLGLPKGRTGEVSQAEFDEVAEDVSQLKSEITDKSDTADMLKAFPTDTASGAVASFSDGANVPVKSLIINIDPVQSGSGDPSPDNVRPISGWSEVNVEHTGANLYSREGSVYGAPVYGADGTVVSYPDVAVWWIKVKPSTKYTVSCIQKSQTTTYLRFGACDANKGFISRVFMFSTNQMPVTITTPSNCEWAQIAVNQYDAAHISQNDWQICIKEGTDNTYEPYSGQSINIALGQTVYGGTLDVLSGVLTPNMDKDDMGTLVWVRSMGADGVYVFSTSSVSAKAMGVTNVISDTFVTTNKTAWNADKPNNSICGSAGSNAVVVRADDYADAASFKAAMSGHYIAYEVANPTTSQLTPHEVRSLLGDNNIWADSGDSAVEYRADPTLYIQRLTEPDADMVADANITSGQYFMVGNTLYKATANIASGATISPNVNCTRKSLSEALNELNA